MEMALLEWIEEYTQTRLNLMKEARHTERPPAKEVINQIIELLPEERTRKARQAAMTNLEKIIDIAGPDALIENGAVAVVEPVDGKWNFEVTEFPVTFGFWQSRNGLKVLHHDTPPWGLLKWSLDAPHLSAVNEKTDEEWDHPFPDLEPETIEEGWQIAQAIWNSIPDPKPPHVLAPLLDFILIDRMCRNQTPERVSARVSVNSENQYSRLSNVGHTVALGRWKETPCGSATVIEVDGEPVASRAVYTPIQQVSIHRSGQHMYLPLPGPTDAIDLRLQLLELQARTGIDRRDPLQHDTATVLALASAIVQPLTTEIDRLAQWMAGQGRLPRGEEALRWRERAWEALDWIRMWMPTPDGDRLPIVRVDTGGNLPAGVVTIWPYDWDKRGGQWSLTGALIHQRARLKAYRGGALAQVALGIEGFLGTSRAYSGKDKTPHLLLPVGPGKAGPWSEWMPYPHLFARSGLYYDWGSRPGRKAASEQWSRMTDKALKPYEVGRDGQEAEAGDTFEIEIEERKHGDSVGRIRVRASARLLEARTLLKGGADKGLGDRPLLDIIDL